MDMISLATNLLNCKPNKSLFFVFTFLLISSISFGQITIQDIPNRKISHNENLVDLSNQLSETERSEINRFLLEIEDSLEYEISVILTHSIGENNPHKFGLKLFNHWGIGDQNKNNGLLILIVLDQRRTEFITGTGLEGILPDGLCYKIQVNKMNPDFKKGNYYQGILNGLLEVKKIYLRSPEEHLKNVNNRKRADISSKNEETESAEPNYFYPSTDRPSLFDLFIDFYTPFLILGSILFILIFILSFFLKDYDKRYRLLAILNHTIWLIVLPIPSIIFKYFIVRTRNKIRYRPRFSPATGEALELLSESEENEFLSKVEIAKEEIGSYDFDVWASKDRKEWIVIPYKKWTKHVTECPNCKKQTQIYKEKAITREPTYFSGGIGLKFYKCQACEHIEIEKYKIPRKKLMKAGSSVGGGGFGSSGSSGSSSGGGGFGGGSSSGGRAGSSW